MLNATVQQLVYINKTMSVVDRHCYTPIQSLKLYRITSSTISKIVSLCTQYLWNLLSGLSNSEWNWIYWCYSSILCHQFSLRRTQIDSSYCLIMICIWLSFTAIATILSLFSPQYIDMLIKKRLDKNCLPKIFRKTYDTFDDWFSKLVFGVKLRLLR